MFGSFFQKRMEYIDAVRQGNELIKQSNINQEEQIKLLKNLDNSTLDEKAQMGLEIKKLGEEIARQKEKINANNGYIQGIRDWLKVSGAIGPLDDEMFINALYDWRIKSRPTEAASRYIPERDMLLKMLKEKNANKAQK